MSSSVTGNAQSAVSIDTAGFPGIFFCSRPSVLKVGKFRVVNDYLAGGGEPAPQKKKCFVQSTIMWSSADDVTDEAF